MRLVLSHPDATEVTEIAPPLRLRIGPLQLAPESAAKQRVRDALLHGLVSGQTVRTVSDEQVHSALGWPVRLLRAQVVRGGKEWVEDRLLAAYRLVTHSAEVLICASEPGVLAARLEELRALLLSGRPDWSSDEVALISELWS